MKSYRDYVEQYNNLIRHKKRGEVAPKRPLYILGEWEKDNGLNESMEGFEDKLTDTAFFDVRLFHELSVAMDMIDEEIEQAKKEGTFRPEDLRKS